MKLIWCNGFLEIYAQLEGVCLHWCSGLPKIYGWLEEGGMGSIYTGICAFFYMWNIVSVVVFHRSMVNWRRGVGSICHGYMCFLLYMKLIWCNGFPEKYGQLEEGGMGSVCTGVVVFHRSIVNWRRGWGQSAISICAFCYLWNLFGVMVFQKSMLSWRRVQLTEVYVHATKCKTTLV